MENAHLFAFNRNTVPLLAPIGLIAILATGCDTFAPTSVEGSVEVQRTETTQSAAPQTQPETTSAPAALPASQPATTTTTTKIKGGVKLSGASIAGAGMIGQQLLAGGLPAADMAAGAVAANEGMEGAAAIVDAAEVGETVEECLDVLFLFGLFFWF